MAEQTGIAWADATMNPWVGCEKVSPGCAHCYAEEWATGWPGTAKGTWGRDGTRRRTSPAKWREPLKWARLAREGRLPNGKPNPDGHRPRVFCASLADVFEDRPELEDWRDDLFAVIDNTPELDWLLLTKRPDVARDWLAAYWHPERYAPNLWLGVSIENARHTWRADVLRQIPAAVRFISAEPLLGSLYPKGDDHGSSIADASDREGGQVQALLGESEGAVRLPRSSPLDGETAPLDSPRTKAPLDLTGIDWIICGGESGPGARPCHLEHFREIIREALGQCDDCRALGGGYAVNDWHVGYNDGRTHWRDCPRRTAVFMKQLGAKPIEATGVRDGCGAPVLGDLVLRDRKGGDIAEFPADLRIREFPR